MQNCFRQYPEIYGSEIDDDEDDMPADASSPDAPSTPAPESTLALENSSPEERAQSATKQVEEQHSDAEKHYAGTAPLDAGNKQQPTATSPAAQANTDEVIPKAAYDSTADNAKVEQK